MSLSSNLGFVGDGNLEGILGLPRNVTTSDAANKKSQGQMIFNLVFYPLKATLPVFKLPRVASY